MSAIRDVDELAVRCDFTAGCGIGAAVKSGWQCTHGLNAAQCALFLVDGEYSHTISRFVTDISPAIGRVQCDVARMIDSGSRGKRGVTGAQSPVLCVELKLIDPVTTGMRYKGDAIVGIQDKAVGFFGCRNWLQWGLSNHPVGCQPVHGHFVCQVVGAQQESARAIGQQVRGVLSALNDTQRGQGSVAGVDAKAG